MPAAITAPAAGQQWLMKAAVAPLFLPGCLMTSPAWGW
jgi:hypothetical protein